MKSILRTMILTTALMTCLAVPAFAADTNAKADVTDNTAVAATEPQSIIE